MQLTRSPALRGPSSAPLRGARWLGYILFVMAFLGCATDRGRGSSAQGGAPEVEATPAGLGASERAASASKGPDLDLSSVMRRVHFAFRPEGEAFSGGHATYRARASAAEVRVVPGWMSGRAVARPGVAPFIASLQGIHRGGRPLAGPSGQASLAEDAALLIDRGGVVERLENTEAGVEQSFAFAERPEGTGDLRVRIAVSGEELLGETERGLHFVDPATGFGVVYGVATWVDAAGKKTPVASRFVEDHIELTVPSNVVQDSLYPAVLDPVIGPEIGMDNPVQVPATQTQSEPVISFGGGSYLVVWTDLRSLDTNSEIFGVRVSPAGMLLDTSSIPIGVAAAGQFRPDVAFDGASWMVVWADNRPDFSQQNIYGARVSSAGAVLDPSGIAVATGGSKDNPAVAFDGTNYLVTYTHATAEVRGTFVSTAGVVNPVPITITTGIYGYHTAVAWNGSNYLVVFASPAGEAARRVTSGGGVLDGADIQVGGTTLQFDVASDGVNWLIAFRDGAGGIRTTRVSAAGALLDGPAGVPVPGGGGGAGLRIAVASGGNGYGVFFDNGTNVFGARVSSGGAVVVPATVITNEAGTRDSPAAAFDGTNYLVAFRDNRLFVPTNPFDIFGVRVSPAIVKVDAASQLISRQANAQKEARVAYNGTNHLVVWSDYRTGDLADVWGTRIDAAGAVLDPSGIAIAQAAGSQLTPSVAAAGSSWLVTWSDGRSGNQDIYAARIQANGVNQDPSGIPVNTQGGDQVTPVVASDGANYMVSWRDDTSFNVWAARVTSAGAVIDPSGVQVSTGGCAEPAIAFNGTRYLVTCTKQINSGDIYGARLSTAGVVLDAGALAIPISANVGVAEQLSAVASNGTDFLVAWNETLNLKVARVSDNGIVLDPVGVLVSSAPNNQTLPAVAWDGTQYWVAWQDDRVVQASPDIYAARVGANGVVKDASGFPVAADALTHERKPALANGPAQKALLVYHRFDPADPFGVERVRARILSDPYPLGAACAAGGQCVSGFCVEGICCDAACAGTCASCLAIKKGSGADGACGPILAGTDPDSECAGQAPSTCKQNGQCDGAGACALHAAGTLCAPGSCAGTTETAPSLCDGLGACEAGVQSMCVEGYTCLADKCATSCLTDAECASGYECDVANQWCILSMGTGGAGGMTMTGGAGGMTMTGGAGGAPGGSGGTTMTGGAGGAPGGSGGAVASGGSTTSSSSSTTSDTSTVPGPGEDGCGCRTPHDTPTSPLALGGLLALAAVLRRRRRARAGSLS